LPNGSEKNLIRSVGKVMLWISDIGYRISEIISGLLTSIGKTSREALISKEPTKFVVKISVNSRCNRVYQK
jgi:hypothetical protein